MVGLHDTSLPSPVVYRLSDAGVVFCLKGLKLGKAVCTQPSFSGGFALAFGRRSRSAKSKAMPLA